MKVDSSFFSIFDVHGLCREFSSLHWMRLCAGGQGGYVPCLIYTKKFKENCMLDILQVGAVTSTHGLAGDVKVFPTTDDPMRYKDLKTVLVERAGASARNLTEGTNNRQKHNSSDKKTPGIKQNGAPKLSEDDLRELTIEHVRFFKNLVILKFCGLDRIEDVEWLRGHALYVTRENAVALKEGEYFIADLIGLSVYADKPFDEDSQTGNVLPNAASGQSMHADKGEKSSESIEKPEKNSEQRYFLGELTDVLQTGANDVYEVKLPDGREVLIPAIRQCILNVDLEQGTMLVHLLEGLLE